MTVGVATCSPDTPVSDLAELIIEKGIEAVVVLNPSDGHALGVVSQDDLVKAFSQRHQWDSKELAVPNAEEVMSAGVPQIPADIPLDAAAQIMIDRRKRTLFLMHHAGGIEYPAAVISYSHILRALTAKSEAEFTDLGIKAKRQSPLDAFIERRDAARKNVASKQK